MTREDLDLVLAAAAKLARGELARHVSALDLFPAQPAPVDLAGTVFHTGLLAPDDFDDAMLATAQAAPLVAVLSETCAGLGAYAACVMAGEWIRRRHAPELADGGTTALALRDAGGPELDEGSLEVATTMSAGRVTGAKAAVRMAGSATSFAVLAMDAGRPSIAFVRRGAAVDVGVPLALLGTRAVPTADVSFTGAEVAKTVPVDLVEVATLVARLGALSASCALATAAAGLEQAWNYAQERVQGGRVIARHEPVALLYERAVAPVVSARHGLAQAAADLDGRVTSRTIAAALRARASGCEAATRALLDAVQILGGYGYMRDYGLEKRLRDAATLGVWPLDGMRAALLGTRLVGSAGSVASSATIGRPAGAIHGSHSTLPTKFWVSQLPHTSPFGS